MLDKGLKATVNSDDPAYFGGYVSDKFRAVQQSLNLPKQDIKTLDVNSIEASFLSEDKKRYSVEEIEKFHRNHS
jgi:adenosine deaminase